MAVYSQLLVNIGGGIIDRTRQSDRQEGAAVAIGIGGIGVDALMNLKKKAHQNLKPDNEDFSVKEYRNIRFLAIDSDAARIRDQRNPADLDKYTEFVDISHRDIVAALGAKKVLENKKELDWFRYEDIAISGAHIGAGGIRQIGRFLLFEKVTVLREKLREAIREAKIGAGYGLDIHIFAGLSGGTGSGCFLDVCYLVRDILSELGITGQTRIYGYFFLPDVNLSVPQAGGNPLISSYMKVNGYAALQELDYLMGIGENGERFRQDYGTFQVDSEEKPVDQCFLVSAMDTSGLLLADGYTHAVNVVTDFVLSLLSRDDDGLTLQGLIPNLDAAKGWIQKQHGASYDYNILGSANAEIPLTKITTYLGAKLFEQWAEIYDKVPQQNDLTEFVSKTNTGFEQIMSSLTRGIDIPFPDFAPKMLMAGNGPAVEKADDWLLYVTGKLEENRRNLVEPLDKDTCQVPGNTTSLTGSVYKALYDTYSIHLDKGPFFAMRLLGGKNNQNLLDVINGYIVRNKHLLEAEHRQNPLRITEYENALEKLRQQEGMLLLRRRRCREYLYQLELLYQHYVKIKRYETMDDLLHTWRNQIVELNNNFFDVLTTVLDNLKDTFRGNERILTQGAGNGNLNTWEILSIPDIQNALDAEVAGLNAGQAFHSFMDKMFAEFPKWRYQNESRIAEMVTEFVLNEFGSASRKTITDYLRVKFQTGNPAALSQKVEDEILENVLERRSEPLFWKNPAFQMADVVRESFLYIPSDAAEIVNAAYNFMSKRGGVSVRRTGLVARISLLKIYAGIPLYAYAGLPELEQAYETDHRPGRHLYEKGEKDWNKILPSPIPASLLIAGYAADRINNRNQELREELERAEQCGIVTWNDSGLTIHRSALPDLDILLTDMGGCRGMSIDRKTLQAIIDGLRQKREKMYQQGPDDVRIRACRATDTKRVLTDDYLRCPVYNRIVREELTKMDALTEEIGKLEHALPMLGPNGRFLFE